MAELDQTYASQRKRLAGLLTAAVAQIIANGLRAKDETVSQLVNVVSAAQAQSVAMVDAYMALKTGQQPKGLDASLYTTAAIRGQAADIVYSRPWGALGWQLSKGADWDGAAISARDAGVKLARTDLQLSQTHSARDWMAGDSSITGWARQINSGNPCSLCLQAAQQVYHTADLMPIHQNCDCTVVPIMGGGGTVSTRSVSPVSVGEIGPQFVQHS